MSDDKAKTIKGAGADLAAPSRRKVIAAGAAVAAGATFSAFPYVSRARAAQTLKFWQFYAPGGQQPGQVKWFTDMVASWNAQNDVKVELDYVPNADYMDGTKLPTAFASGQGPDIFIISPGDFLRYYNGGVLLDLTPFMEEKAKADFPEGIIASRKVDDKIYALPMEVEPMAMYYSIDAFDKAGLNENDVPKTWDQLMEVGKKLTNDKRYGVLTIPLPATTRTSPGTPSCGRAAANSRTRAARAPSIRRAPLRP